MVDLGHLRDKQVVFRLVGAPTVYFGKVTYVDEGTGLWIDAPSIAGELLRDSAWKPAIQAMSQPVFFVPFSSLVFLATANT